MTRERIRIFIRKKFFDDRKLYIILYVNICVCTQLYGHNQFNDSREYSNVCYKKFDERGLNIIDIF